MIKTYIYNRKAARAFSWILRRAKKIQRISYDDIQLHMNLNGINIGYDVLCYIFRGERIRVFPLETLVLLDILNLDSERVYCALLFAVNDDPRARQAMEDAATTVAVRVV